MTRAQFWSDGFDMDLLRVCPEAIDALGETGQRVLYVRGGTSHGRLNHPSAWGHDRGFVSFFGHRGPTEPPSWCSGEPVRECTVEEMIRDAWVHDLVCVVDGVEVFDGATLAGDFQRWMYHLRGWALLTDRQLRPIRENLLRRVREARRALETMSIPQSTPLRASTARIGTKGLIDALDITRKSASGDGLAFAPSWSILTPALSARREAEDARKAGRYREANTILDLAWEVYRPLYIEEMRESLRRARGPWDRLLTRGHVTLLCYCANNPEQCHRTLLAREILPKLGAIYGFEVRA